MYVLNVAQNRLSNQLVTKDKCQRVTLEKKPEHSGLKEHERKKGE